MKRVVMLVVVLVGLGLVCAPELARLYPQYFGWYTELVAKAGRRPVEPVNWEKVNHGGANMAQSLTARNARRRLDDREGERAGIVMLSPGSTSVVQASAESLSSSTVLVSGDLNDPGNAPVAAAARRYRKVKSE